MTTSLLSPCSFRCIYIDQAIRVGPFLNGEGYWGPLALLQIFCAHLTFMSVVTDMVSHGLGDNGAIKAAYNS